MIDQIKKMKMSSKLDNAQNVKEVFDIVKEVVIDTFAIRRPGLTIALGNLQKLQNSIILGGFYSPMDNAIVVNKSVLENIKVRDKKLYNRYLFHILLHEYLHSLGFVDEKETRKIAFLISNKNFGLDHEVTKIAINPGYFIRNFVDYKNNEFQEDEFFDETIEEKEFDRSIINYIG